MLVYVTSKIAVRGNASYTVTLTDFFSEGAVPVRTVRWPEPNWSRIGPACLVLQGEVSDVAAGYPDGLRRAEIADDAFLPGQHGHHAAVHVAVELYADILAVYARAFRGETGGARRGDRQ